MKKSATNELVFCGLFTALIAVGAFIRIPIPMVPFTLQYLFTMLAGILLGPRLGAASVLCYCILGLAGLPIFAEGGGLTYIFRPSFGYLIGFCAGAYVTGIIAYRVYAPSFKRLLFAGLMGLLVVYAFGMAYYWGISTFYLDTRISLRTLFLYCFLLAVPGDILLCALAAILGERLVPILKKERGLKDANRRKLKE